MPTIPKNLHDAVNTAFPDEVCLVGTVLPNGFAQVSPRGSVMVFDGDHLALWERGHGSTNEHLQDGSKVTVFMRRRGLRADGTLPKGGIARFYGTAKLHKSGAFYDDVWKRLIEPEKKRDPNREGFAVLVRIARTEDLDGEVLKD